MVDLSRRDFVKKSAITVAVTSSCLCGLGGCATYTKVGSTPAAASDSVTLRNRILSIDLSKEPRLSRIGSAVKIAHPDIPDGLIIAHVAENQFEVVSLLCTHRGVEVEYDHQQGHFQCASLGSSIFSIDGKNVSGPAGRPLKEYEATLDNGRLTLSV